MNTYRFYKNEAGWFIDHPAYIQQGGTVADLEMVDGADTMLDIIAAGGNDVHLTISKEPFEGGHFDSYRKMLSLCRSGYI